MPRRKTPAPFTSKIGARIRALRVERNMSLAQLADAGGLSKGHISSVEHGLAAITVETLERIARALDALPMDLVTFPDEEDRGRIADIVRRMQKKDVVKLRREIVARAPEGSVPARRRATSARA